jgi:hypothetical protein
MRSASVRFVLRCSHGESSCRVSAGFIPSPQGRGLPAQKGKSYGAVPTTALTLERFVADALALTLYLGARFHQDTVYVFGST